MDQLHAAHAAGIALGIVLADSGYGYDSQFREEIIELGLLYAVGIARPGSPRRECYPALNHAGMTGPPVRAGTAVMRHDRTSSFGPDASPR